MWAVRHFITTIIIIFYLKCILCKRCKAIIGILVTLLLTYLLSFATFLLPQRQFHNSIFKVFLHHCNDIWGWSIFIFIVLHIIFAIFSPWSIFLLHDPIFHSEDRLWLYFEPFFHDSVLGHFVLGWMVIVIPMAFLISLFMFNAYLKLIGFI